jgi:CBS domain-containing protein
MIVGSICRHGVVTVTQGTDLVAAARLMREKHVGYLVVVEPATKTQRSQVIGVLTDRDIVVAVVAREIDPRTLTVGDAMTRDPLYADEGDTLEGTLNRMRHLGVRRVPVIGNDGELRGVLSLDDALDALADQLSNIAGVIRNEQRAERAVRA